MKNILNTLGLGCVVVASIMTVGVIAFHGLRSIEAKKRGAGDNR